MNLEELKKSYETKKDLINQRLDDFKKEKNDDELFAELAFCLLTPQSKAKLCWLSIEKLKEKGLLFSSSSTKIRPWITTVRFCDNKSRYIEEAQNKFPSVKEVLKKEPEQAREWLVENIKGYGYKEASHFLRNIGILDFAILDRHILKNLKKYGVIKEIPKSLTPKKYFEIEKRMKEFSAIIGISLAELDLLFWSQETGEVFK